MTQCPLRLMGKAQLGSFLQETSEWLGFQGIHRDLIFHFPPREDCPVFRDGLAHMHCFCASKGFQSGDAGKPYISHLKTTLTSHFTHYFSICPPSITYYPSYL